MLQVRLLGQFDIRADGKPITIPSRAGQSLFAYLVLNAGTAYRREKLAGLFWPDVSDENARRNLRQELWRIRKALANVQSENIEYVLVQEISLAFNGDADYWLDVAQLERPTADTDSPSELISRLTLYRGELLPGFYDDWAVLERERLHAVFEQGMQRLMELLIREQRWMPVLEWGERWITLGQSPEPAYRSLMIAFAALGDRAKVTATFERCRAALDKELGVEPAEETQALLDQLMRGEPVAGVNLTSTQVAAAHPRVFDEPPAPGEPPFKGLQYFDEGDADWFFGRELLTAKLVGHLRDQDFLAVIVGASGSGKSSIVRAGLIPALRKGQVLADGTLPPDASQDWQVHILTPTAHPLEALAVSFTRDSESITAMATLIDDLARDPRALRLYVHKSALNKHRHVLLIIDQFEELFTLCRDEFERQAFLDNLLTVLPSSDRRNGDVTLVIVLRADFYAHLAQYEELRDAVATQQEYIGPMTTDELRRAMEEPAHRGNWEFEPGLVDLVLRDVGNEPGALPLLSHALLETFKRRSGRTLTLKGYTEAGGVRGAIAQTAETVYAQLNTEQQAIARNIFLRLTELGEGTEDTRRRASFTELISQAQNAATVRAVLNTLAEARLVTLSEDTAEVAHEALIREWTTLREWLTQDRDGLRLHRHLTQTAQEWELLERDPGSLYRGARLAQAREWVSTTEERINELERAFLQRSVEQEQREEQEREAQRQRELKMAQELAEEQAQAAKQLRRRARFLAGACLLAVVMAAIALFFGDQARQSASAAQANARQAQTTSRIAFARELSVASVNNLEADPERSILLALQAVSEIYSVDKTVLPEAVTALHRAVSASHLQRTLVGHTDTIWSIIYSPDGTRIATASQDGTAKVWDASTGKELLTLRGHTGSVNGIAYSPDGKYLATASDDGTAKLWDATSGKELATFSGQPDGVTRVAFSPDGTRLVTTSYDKTGKVWGIATGKELFTLSGHTDMVFVVNYSPDGTRIATAGSDGSVKLWDATNGKELLSLATANGQKGCLAFSPDGKRLAASSGADVKIWDATSGQQVASLSGHTDAIYSVAYSPDGALLATASRDGTAKIWDAVTGKELLTLAGHDSEVQGIAFSRDGTHVATAGVDSTAKVWDITPGKELLTVNTQASRRGVTLSSDGTRMAMGFVDGTAKVWDAMSGKELLTLHGHTGEVFVVKFSRDGSRLATASSDGTAKIWDASTGKEILTLRGHTQLVYYVDFNPDGTRLATGSADNTAKIWDTSTGKEIFTLDGNAGSVNAVAFSPDGTRLATANDNGTILWDALTGKEMLTLSGHHGPVPYVGFNGDGKRLITASTDGTAKVWDTTTGQELLTLSGHSGTVISAAFSPDGTRLATASLDKTAKVWDAATGKELFTLYGDIQNNAGFTAVNFSPDGTRLVASNALFPTSGSIRVYLAQTDDLVALARSRLTRAWTLAECQKFLHMEQCPEQP